MPPPAPPPVEQWPWFQAEHIKRQTAALESIRACAITTMVCVVVLVVAVLLAAGTR
jgi:hypothetical protein